MMKCFIADGTADLPRLREILKSHAAVRTSDVRCIFLRRGLLLIATENPFQKIICRDILLLCAQN